jgi:hypothetical protein
VPDGVTILVSASISFGLALAVLYLSRRAGLTDVQAAVSAERSALVETIKSRVSALEAENERLKTDMDYLKRENEQLRIEVDRLRRYIIDHRVGPTDAGD